MVMAQRLSDEEVAKIAALARIELSPDDTALFAQQLGDILAYVNELQAVDTTGIEPTSHPLPLDLVWRADTPVPSLDRSRLLEGAPGTSPRTGLFKVPKVL
jgi:aspartyl-tRNA(Asn)/glutamyl-tRNA(Gln) amidotransferase subunit C